MLASALAAGRAAAAPVCFLAGTMIRTAKGDRAVETLQPGDLIETRSGTRRPVVRLVYHRFSVTDPESMSERVMPIRIAGGAFGEGAPARDLYLSPGHSVLFEGGLAPVRQLVNGKSITPALPPGIERIEYVHIQLEAHDVIYAEGLLCETLPPAGRDVQFAAPIAGFRGGRDEVKARLRSALSPWIDIRTADDRFRDRVEERAL